MRKRRLKQLVSTKALPSWGAFSLATLANVNGWTQTVQFWLTNTGNTKLAPLWNELIVANLWYLIVIAGILWLGYLLVRSDNDELLNEVNHPITSIGAKPNFVALRPLILPAILDSETPAIRSPGRWTAITIPIRNERLRFWRTGAPEDTKVEIEYIGKTHKGFQFVDNATWLGGRPAVLSFPIEHVAHIVLAYNWVNPPQQDQWVAVQEDKGHFPVGNSFRYLELPPGKTLAKLKITACDGSYRKEINYLVIFGAAGVAVRRYPKRPRLALFWAKLKRRSGFKWLRHTKADWLYE